MKYRHRVLALLWSLSLLTFLDRVCISVAGPRMQSELKMTPEQWGWVVGCFSLAYAAFEAPSGMLGDRIGPRRVLFRIVLWWSAFTVLTGTVTSYVALLATRLAFGAGEAGAFPNMSVCIGRWFPVAERARAQGLIWMASRLGAALSPLIVVPIQVHYGWRATFWIFGAAGVVWAAFWQVYYRENPVDQEGITHEELVAIGSSQKVRQSMPWKVALRNRSLQHIVAMYFCYCYAAYFYISWLHTFLVKGRGFAPHELAVLSTLPFVCGAVSNVLGGITSDRLVRRWPKTARKYIGAVSLAASGAFTFAVILAQTKIQVILFLTLAYTSSDFMLPSAWAVCVDVGSQYAGTVSGVMNTVGQFGSFLSSIIFGYTVAAFHSYNAPLVLIGAMLLVSATQWLSIDPTQEIAPEPAPEPSESKIQSLT